MNEATEKIVGEVTNFFAKISVAGIDLSSGVKVGDTLHFKGATTDFTQLVESMQIDRNQVMEAKAGDSIGIKVKEEVRKGDKIYIVSQS